MKRIDDLNRSREKWSNPYERKIREENARLLYEAEEKAYRERERRMRSTMYTSSNVRSYSLTGIIATMTTSFIFTFITLSLLALILEVPYDHRSVLGISVISSGFFTFR